MGAIYDNDFYQGNEPTLSEPLRFPKIGYDNVVSGADLVASTSVAGFPVESLANSFTFELWKPSELPATVDVDAGRAVTVDYVAFGAHNLTGCEVTLSYSTDGTTYTEAVSGVYVRNKSGMMLFEPVTARYFRLTVLGWAVNPTLDFDFVNQTYALGDYAEADNTYIGVMFLGKCLEMQRGIYQGHTPGEFARNDEIRPSVSEGGQWLGRSVVRRGYETGYSFSNLKADWVRSTLAPFLDAAVTDPFFIAWRPETKADEVLFGWSNNPIVPTNSGPRDHMSVDFNVAAHGETPVTGKFEADDVAYDVALDLTVQSPKLVYTAEGLLAVVPAGEPAYEHDPLTGEPLGQLIEEQRTNLLLWSEDFSQGDWVKSNGATVVEVVPEEYNRQWLIEATQAAVSGMAQPVAVTSGVTYTHWCIAKKSVVNEIRLQMPSSEFGTGAARKTTFDLNSGMVTSGEGGIKPLSDDSFLCWQTAECLSTSASSSMQLYIGVGAAAIGDSVLVSKRQCEAGAAPSSYIKTEGSQVTRAADRCRRTLGEEFKEDSSTFLVEFTTLGGGQFEGIVSIGGAPNERYLEIGQRPDGSAFVDLRSTVNGYANTVDITPSSPGGYRVRVGVALRGGKQIVSANGELVATFAAENLPEASGLLGVGVRPWTGVSARNRVLARDLRYYPRALTESELIALTTPEA